MPGPLIEANLGDDLEVTVHNFAQLETVDIHWHGVPQVGDSSRPLTVVQTEHTRSIFLNGKVKLVCSYQAGTPWEDGAYMITGCGIPPVSGSHTYK